MKFLDKKEGASSPFLRIFGRKIAGFLIKRLFIVQAKEHRPFSHCRAGVNADPGIRFYHFSGTAKKSRGGMTENNGGFFKILGVQRRSCPKQLPGVIAIQGFLGIKIFKAGVNQNIGTTGHFYRIVQGRIPEKFQNALQNLRGALHQLAQTLHRWQCSVCVFDLYRHK